MYLDIPGQTRVDIRIVHRQWDPEFRREQPVERVQGVEDSFTKVPLLCCAESLEESIGTAV